MATEEGNPRFLELLKEARELHIRKAKGYSGSSTDTWENFREALRWGMTPAQGCQIRLGDKYRRVQNLLRTDYTGDDETVYDTLRDLAAYSLILICLLEEEVTK